MDIHVPYGKDQKIPVTVPDENVLGVVYPNEVSQQNQIEILLRAIENPIRSRSFANFLSDAKDVLFIVNDGTRPTPTAKVLEVIYDQIRDKNVRFMVSTGVHRAPIPEEFDFIFGKYHDIFRDCISVHDSDKDEDMLFLGSSHNGTEMYVNRLGMEADKIVIIGSVEPHYFAGYTGGRKSFLPGIAARRTVAQNHRFALQREARALALDGNPVHEDMIDALKTIADKEIFSIQTVLAGDRRLYAVTTGHIHESFYAAIDKANEVFCPRVPEKADIVVTVAPYPMDTDLYQAQKALENGKLVLKKGGILILVSKCRTGIGDPTFFELLSAATSPQEALAGLTSGYELGYHKAAKIAELGTWAEMWGVTDLDDTVVNAVFMKPFHGLQDTLNQALRKRGRAAKILFLMDGSITVPIIG